ncbi:hypothetical protein [Pseudomonas helleri]
MNKIVPDPPLDAFHTSAHRGTLLFATHPVFPHETRLNTSRC